MFPRGRVAVESDCRRDSLTKQVKKDSLIDGVMCTKRSNGSFGLRRYPTSNRLRIDVEYRWGEEIVLFNVDLINDYQCIVDLAFSPKITTFVSSDEGLAQMRFPMTCNIERAACKSTL